MLIQVFKINQRYLRRRVIICKFNGFCNFKPEKDKIAQRFILLYKSLVRYQFGVTTMVAYRILFKIHNYKTLAESVTESKKIYDNDTIPVLLKLIALLRTRDS